MKDFLYYVAYVSLSLVEFRDIGIFGFWLPVNRYVVVYHEYPLRQKHEAEKYMETGEPLLL